MDLDPNYDPSDFLKIPSMRQQEQQQPMHEMDGQQYHQQQQDNYQHQQPQQYQQQDDSQQQDLFNIPENMITFKTEEVYILKNVVQIIIN